MNNNFRFILFYSIRYDPFRSVSIITFVHNSINIVRLLFPYKTKETSRTT